MGWFNVKEIREEIKNKVRWPKKDDMIKDSETVLSFIALFAIFFVICEFVVAQFLRIFGIGA